MRNLVVSDDDNEGVALKLAGSKCANDDSERGILDGVHEF